MARKKQEVTVDESVIVDETQYDELQVEQIGELDPSDPLAQVGEIVVEPSSTAPEPEPKVETEEQAITRELAEQTAVVDGLAAQVAELQSKLASARQVQDKLTTRLEALQPIHSNTLDIQQYLAAQKRAMQDRGARRQAAQASGLLDLTKGLTTPLDAAMARKNDRGTQRPGE